jgi:hypothetical protein
MLPITTDFVLDALNLACFSEKEEAKQILERILDMYEAAKSRKNQVAVDPDMETIFVIISDLVKNETSMDKKSDRNRIILKIKASELAKKDQMLVDNVAEMLKQGAEQGISQRKEDLLIKRMQNWATFSSVNEKLLDSLSLCRKYSIGDETKNDLIMMNLMEKANELTKVQDTIVGTVECQDELDFTSKRSMQLSYTRYDNNRKKNVFKLGLQGLNALFGEAGGVTRGEFVGIAAASHHGKSLTLNSISRWATVYNKYELKDPTKIPTILHITLENNVSNNFIAMAKQAYISSNHRPVPRDMTMDELVDFNYAYYNRLGNKLIMRKFNGEDFGFSNLLKLIANLEAKGHEIVVLVIDYLSLMKPEGNEKNNAAQDLVHLFQRCYDLAQAKDITIFTGIQLDADAERLIASGEVCPVKKLSAATLSDAKGIKKPLDVLIFQVIENTPDGSYMTWYINKHRDHNLPKMSERFIAYQFLGEDLGIMDDLGGKDMSIRDIYANTSSKEESPKDDIFAAIKTAAS